ncbi:hypothetical protein BAY61_20850 [Prauserella marina]|uniref:Uncharacterized protein n=1 Tax=Prauserella marina TaxID=530584 RepID=A0A222VSV8_9PSEU|nr:hypothetical protein [Prauserella marina]ASR37025.1 hypothetical protein BAY61_20850 [Prauserella marina]PWV79999.1 hypothetical protein DES30_10385 [Prauserella marina]SDD85377.1 hypothetical protein SAMN05421630_113132 [Prauserella marina]
MRAIRRLTAKGKPPHEIAAEVPPARLVAALVRNLADSVGGDVAYAKPGGRSPVVVESWPPGVTGIAGAAGVAPVRGGGSLYVMAPGRWDEAARSRHHETAAWLGMALRLVRLGAEHEAAELRARRLSGERATAVARLDVVRDLERQRLAGAVTTTTLRDLGEVRRGLRAAIKNGGDGDGNDGLAEARDALDELIDSFRVVVRGVFPAMLPDSGPRAALEELAATLSRPVSFTGELGLRAGWQLESGFYHAVAAALNLLAGAESARPVTVSFARDDALRATLSAEGTPDLAALRQDVERVAVLGGELRASVKDGVAHIGVRLPERVEPLASTHTDPSELERSSIYRQVRELVRQGREATSGTPERAAWDAVAERLPMAPRLAVVGDLPDPGELPGVAVLVVDAPADRALAEEFLADEGPRGGIDAVLCAVAPSPEFRRALRSARNRVVLAEAGTVPVAVVAAALAARGPVIAAKRAVVGMSALVRSLPPGHRLRWAVDRVRVDTHEFAELELLDAIEHGELLRAVAVAATRLLGARGIDARSRLGLPSDAADDVVASAARAAVSGWRAHAAHPVVGGRERAACELLARTAEGLIT